MTRFISKLLVRFCRSGARFTRNNTINYKTENQRDRRYLNFPQNGGWVDKMAAVIKKTVLTQ